MRFLQRGKKMSKESKFDISEFVVLGYDELLQVNGAGGKSGSGGGGGPTGPSAAPTSSTTLDSNRGYPSSTEGHSSSSPASSGNLSDKGYPSSTAGYNPSNSSDNLSSKGYPSSSSGYNTGEPTGVYGAPTDSRRVTGVIGESTNLQKNHTGVDIGAQTPGVKGDPIYATADGVVIRNGTTSNSGSTRVELSLPNTSNTAVYQHGDFIVEEGQSVKKGDVIGYMSDNGTSGNVHLHYEIRPDGQYTTEPSKMIDPLDYMPPTYKKVN